MTTSSISPPAATGRSAPLALTLLVLPLTGVLAVSQFYVVIPIFDQLAQTWDVSNTQVTWTQTVFGVAYSTGFLLWGRGAATFAPAAFAYLGTRIEARHRALALTVLTSSFFAASIVGQIVSQLLAGENDWNRVFLASGVGFAAAAAALALVILPGSPATRSSKPSASIWKLVSQPPIPFLLPATLTIMSGFVAIYTAIELSGIVTDTTELLWLRVSGLPAMMALPFLVPLLARLHALTRLSYTLAASAVLTLLLALPGSHHVVIMGVVVFGLVLTIGAAAPSAVESIMAFGDDKPGAATSLYVFTLFLGASLGSQVSSIAGHDVTTTAIIAAGLLGAGVLLTRQARLSVTR